MEFGLFHFTSYHKLSSLSFDNIKLLKDGTKMIFVIYLLYFFIILLITYTIYIYYTTLAKNTLAYFKSKKKDCQLKWNKLNLFFQYTNE